MKEKTMFRIFLLLIITLLSTQAMARPRAVDTLFVNRTTDGNSDAFVFNVNTGYMQMVAKGTWNGATVTLYSSDDEGTTWVEYRDGVFCTADCNIRVWESHGMMVRATVSGAGGSTDVTVKLYKLEN